MTGSAHALLGAAAGAAAASSLHAPPVPAALLGAAAGLLPDMDLAGTHGRATGLAALALTGSAACAHVIDPSRAALAGTTLAALLAAGSLTGHRGLTHSLLGLALATLAAAALLPLSLAAACAAGYLAHLCGDALSRSSVPWLFPLDRGRRAGAPDRSAHRYHRRTIL
jgi:inner membrane protein